MLLVVSESATLLPQNSGIMMKNYAFLVNEKSHITDELELPEDVLPLSVLHESCKWAYKPIIAVMYAFHRNKYFKLLPNSQTITIGNPFGREFYFRIHYENNNKFSFVDRLRIAVSDKGLRITIESQNGGFSPFYKEWRRPKYRSAKKSKNSRRRPKWRKFGAFACSRLLQYHNLEDIKHVMEI